MIEGSVSSLDTFKRIYSPASNVNREPEDGCMKKIKIELSLKLRKEDLISKKTNIVTNNQEIEENCLGSFGDQKEIFYDKVMPIIENIHKEKAHIANAMTE